MDKISKEARSRNMAAIKHKDTEPELVIRRGLHALGLRYRIHKKNLVNFGIIPLTFVNESDYDLSLIHI